jgi:hypothetical protein
MNNLTENDIIRVMREEWNKKIQKLTEEVKLSLTAKVDGKEVEIASPGFKAKNKKSQKLYTVASTGPDVVTLVSADGKEKFVINGEQWRNEYVPG